MPPRIDEGINAQTELGTVGNRTTPHRKFLVDGTERATEEREREFLGAKRTDKRTENQFFLNVMETMFRILKSGRIIPGSVLGTWRLREIRVPAVSNCGDQFICVEISGQGVTPDICGKGRRQERDPSTIHVWRGGFPAFIDLFDETDFKGWARALWELVTVTRGRRGCVILRRKGVQPNALNLCKIIKFVVGNVEKTGVVMIGNDKTMRDRPVRTGVR